MEERKVKQYRSESERREIVERWESSGESANDFCRRAGINISLFYKWRRNFGAVPGTSFVEIKANKESAARVMIECRNGRRVSVEGLTLSAVLASVEAA